MSLLQLIILAIIQGITEFIPVSSSAHLAIAPMMIPSWEDQGPLIDVAMHVGSLGAVMVYFRRDVGALFQGGLDTVLFRETADRHLFLLIAVATIPFVIVGGALYLADMTTLFRDPMIIGIASIFFGLLLWWSDRPKSENQTELVELPDAKAVSYPWTHVMAIGLAQAFAIIPGTSRSGVTITAARFLGISRPEAARFSMLMAIPTICILGLVAGKDLLEGKATASFVDGVVGAGFAFVAALATIHLFMKMTAKMSFLPFVIYRIALGLVLIALALL